MSLTDNNATNKGVVTKKEYGWAASEGKPIRYYEKGEIIKE